VLAGWLGVRARCPPELIVHNFLAHSKSRKKRGRGETATASGKQVLRKHKPELKIRNGRRKRTNHTTAPIRIICLKSSVSKSSVLVLVENARVVPVCHHHSLHLLHNDTLAEQIKVLQQPNNQRGNLSVNSPQAFAYSIARTLLYWASTSFPSS